VCPSVCVKTDTQRNKKKKDNHRSPCPTVKTRKGTKILTETRREEVPPCGLLSVTQEEFFQFDFFSGPGCYWPAHSIRWGLAAAAAAVCVIIIIRPVPKEVVVCSSSKHKEQEQE
jgi:hypothetical protein